MTIIKNNNEAYDLLMQTLKLCKSEELTMIVSPAALGELENFESIKPNFIACKEGQEPGKYYKNCCPANEFNQFTENIDLLLGYKFDLGLQEILKVPNFRTHLKKKELCGIDVQGYLKLTKYENASFVNGLNCQTKDEKDFLWYKTYLQLIHKQRLDIKEDISKGVPIKHSIINYIHVNKYEYEFNSSSFLFIPLLFLVFFKIILKKTKKI